MTPAAVYIVLAVYIEIMCRLGINVAQEMTYCVTTDWRNWLFRIASAGG